MSQRQASWVVSFFFFAYLYSRVYFDIFQLPASMRARRDITFIPALCFRGLHRVGNTIGEGFCAELFAFALFRFAIPLVIVQASVAAKEKGAFFWPSYRAPSCYRYLHFVVSPDVLRWASFQLVTLVLFQAFRIWAKKTTTTEVRHASMMMAHFYSTQQAYFLLNTSCIKKLIKNDQTSISGASVPYR